MQVPPDETFNLALRERHLEQLRYVEILEPDHRIPTQPWPLPPGAPSPFDQLVEWSMQAKEQIARAVAKRQ